MNQVIRYLNYIGWYLKYAEKPVVFSWSRRSFILRHIY
jgi:hypothetical protein